jgi:hypothetical protein
MLSLATRAYRGRVFKRRKNSESALVAIIRRSLWAQKDPRLFRQAIWSETGLPGFVPTLGWLARCSWEDRHSTEGADGRSDHGLRRSSERAQVIGHEAARGGAGRVQTRLPFI